MTRTRAETHDAERADTPFAAWKMPDLEGVDELSAQAFRAFLATARLHFKTMMATMAGSRTHPGQAMCLRLLAANDGATQRDMARMLHVAPPTVSKMLRTMEKAGLVERRPDQADQRLTRVYLTTTGRERELEMGAAVGEYVNATFATLTKAERAELARLLDKLGAAIGRATAAQGLAAKRPSAGRDSRAADGLAAVERRAAGGAVAAKEDGR